MATFIKNMFRPKWQSNNPEVRKNALLGLDCQSDKTLEILKTTLETDDVHEIKVAALGKIDDMDYLIGFALEQSPAQFPELKNKLTDLFQKSYERDPSLSVLKQTPGGNETIEKLLPWIDDETLISTFISLLPSGPILETLAVEGKSTKIRQQALQSIHDEAALKNIVKLAKNRDKRVYQIAKDRLAKLKTEREAAQAVQDHVLDLIGQIQQHADSEVTRLYGPKLRALIENWKQVASVATPEQQHSVTNALSRSEAKVRAYETKLETAEKELQESNAKQLERNGTLTTLVETINELEHLTDLDTASPPALLGVIKSQESRWMEATRDTQVDKAEQKQYQLLMNQVKRYSTALEQYQMAHPAMSSILSGAQNLSATDQRKLDEHLKTLSWPDALPTPDLIQQAEKALGRMSEIKQKKAQDAQTLKSQIEEQISELETALDSKVLKQTTRRYQELQKLLQSAPDKISKAYQARFHLLGKQLGELRDWQGFATHPKQLELCTLMEALVDQHLEPQLKADKIKALQDEWKTLGGSSDQSLWNRFKAASDAAYEPCKAFFSEQKQLKRVNLEKRMTLCDQLQAFLDQNDWKQPDWKAVEKIERKAKEEWKESFPIDFKDNKPVQKRFNILIGALDEKLNQEKAQNLGKKQAICTQAEELIILEPMSEAIQQVKELQRQWTEIGITPYKEDRQLWKTFRTACDAIFARRDEQRKSAADKEQQNNAKAQQLIETVEVLVAKLIGHPTDSDNIDPVLQNTRQQLRQTETELNQLELNSRDQSRFKAQLKDLKHHVLELQSKLGARQRYEQLSAALQFSAAVVDSGLTEASIANSDSLLSRHQKLLLLAQGDIESLAEKSKNSLAELCILVEILTGQDSPKEDQALRMQLQVQRLSEGFSGAQAEDTEDNLEAILDQWLIKVRAAPEDEMTATVKQLGQRLDQAIKHYYLNG